MGLLHLLVPLSLSLLYVSESACDADDCAIKGDPLLQKEQLKMKQHDKLLEDVKQEHQEGLQQLQKAQQQQAEHEQQAEQSLQKGLQQLQKAFQEGLQQLQKAQQRQAEHEDLQQLQKKRHELHMQEETGHSRDSARIQGDFAIPRSHTDLFEGCRGKRRPAGPSAPKGSVAAEHTLAEIKNNVSGKVHGVSPCSAGFIALLKPTRVQMESSCCPVGDRRCAGCESWHPSGQELGSCQKCRGGFVMLGGLCVSCLDTVGWMTDQGQTCQQLRTSETCSDHRFKGLSSKQACCHCGGGHPTATPFQYKATQVAVGDEVDLLPEPRTAERYSVDQSCQLARYGLLMDGETGRVSGRPTAPEPITVECQVTAHQSDALTYTAGLKITTNYIAYPSQLLVFPMNYSPQLVRGNFSDFDVKCAPEVEWLTISGTGELQKRAGAASGAVTSAEDRFEGQAGGVCTVTAWAEPQHKTLEATVLALELRPWPSLRYETTSITATVGEQAPPLLLQTPSSLPDGSLKPSFFSVACDITAPVQNAPAFIFDAQLGAGFVDGHLVLELRKDGSILVSPAASLIALFDSPEFSSADSAARKDIVLSCRVYGHFAEPRLAPIYSEMQVKVEDNICFIKQHLRLVGTEVAQTSLAGCRWACRELRSCSHFAFTMGKCYQYRRDPGGSMVTAWAKITDCSGDLTCLDMITPEIFYLQGRYCPIGQDVLRGTVYLRKGVTPQETLYLVKNIVSVDGQTAGARNCTSPSKDGYVLREAAPELDYVNKEKGHFELRGPVQACFSPDLIQNAFSSIFNERGAALSPGICPAPEVAVKGEEEDEKVVVQPLMLGNSSGTEENDFWLHPCDCIPPLWGNTLPVSPESFEEIPAQSQNLFIPPPFLIVEGQFVCDMEQLLEVIVEGEEGAWDESKCETRCKDDDKCGFYWHGYQRDAITCRLYRGCDVLVREFAMAGKLVAVPKKKMCRIANPEACWATTLRRSFLTDLHSTKCSSHSCSRGKVHKADYDKIICGFSHQADGQCTDEKCCQASDLSLLDEQSGAVGHGSADPDSEGPDAEKTVTSEEVNDDQGESILSTSAEELRAVSLDGEEMEQGESDRPSEEGQPEEPSKIGSPVPSQQMTNGSLLDVGSGGSGTYLRHGDVIWIKSVRYRWLFCDTGHCKAAASCPDSAANRAVTSDTGCWGERFRIYNAAHWGGIKSGDVVWIRSIRHRWFFCDTGHCKAAARCPDSAANRAVTSNTGCYGERFKIYNSQNLGYILPGDVIWLRSVRHWWLYCDTGGCKASAGCPESAARRAVTSDTGCWGERFKIYGPWSGKCGRQDCCPDGYYRSNDQCHVKQCRCNHGTAGTGSLCPTHGTQSCTACSSSAHKTGNLCPLKQCTCSHGTGGSGSSCPTNGAHHCVACDGGQGYYLSNERCQAKQCTCQNGIGAQLMQCPSHGDDFCISCSLGYELVKTDKSVCVRQKLKYKIPGFHYLHLHQQCDQALLLGGIGVEMCSRPTFADPDSHEWAHKRQLPKTFDHGDALVVSCWPERFQGVSLKGDAIASQELRCVNGNWFDSLGRPGLSHFGCAPCSQVSAKGYTAYDSQKKQEMVWHNKIRTRMYTDLERNYCIKRVDGKIKIKPGKFCDEFLLQDVPATTEESRQVSFADARSQCLSGTIGRSHGEVSLESDSCDTSSVKQLIAAKQIPSMLWAMHSEKKKTVGPWRAATNSMTQLSGTASCKPTGVLGMISLGSVTPVCHFAPVLQESSEQLASWGTPAGQASAKWRHELAAASVDCGEGALSALRATSQGLHYNCAVIAGLGACTPTFSSQMDVQTSRADPHGIKVLDKLHIMCSGDDVIGSFVFEHSDTGGWVRWRYTCCKAGGVPTVMDPVGMENSLFQEDEGIYCPARMDASGRLQYVRKTSPSGTNVEKMLSYNPLAGQWCVGARCVDSSVVEPFGVQGSDFEVVSVSDFDGEFEAKGVPKEHGTGSGADELLKKSSKLRRPKPPRPPKKPTLVAFEPLEPEYAKECKFEEFNDPQADGNLWESLEDHGDAEGKNTVTKLQWAEQRDLPDNHPCKVAQEGAGVFDNTYADGDGEEHDHLSYDALSGCESREIHRGLVEANIEYSHAMVQIPIDLMSAGFQIGCSAIPNVVIAPIGAGAEMEPGKFCEAAQEQIGLFGSMANDLWKNTVVMDMAHKGAADCDPLQVNMARLFCDIHCVRDAVVRGDLNLRRNMKAATATINHNIAQFAQWNVDSMNSQTNWLADKIDYVDTKLSKQIEAVADLLASPAPTPDLLQTASSRVSSMLTEMQGFTQQAASSATSRISAERALSDFVSTADRLSDANATRAVEALQQITALHAVLKISSGQSKTSSASTMLLEGVQQMQEAVRKQMDTLGIYRRHSEQSQNFVRSFSAARASMATMLIEMDRIWWRLRREIDSYMDHADEQIKAFSTAFDALADYRGCSSGFSEVLTAYDSAMAAREMAHGKLQEVWRESSNLLGELASVVIDGDIFATLMAQEGCDSNLARQTLKQAKLSVGAMRLLLHRFKVGGLPLPSTELLIRSVQRIQHSYQQSVDSCKGAGLQL